MKIKTKLATQKYIIYIQNSSQIVNAITTFIIKLLRPTLIMTHPLIPLDNLLLQKLQPNNSRLRVPFLYQIEPMNLLNQYFLSIMFMLDNSDQIVQ